MTISKFRFALLALLASTLVACGGGAEAPASRTPVAKALPLKAEAWVQPAGAHDLLMVKHRAVVAPAPQAAQLHLGPLSQAKTFGQDAYGVREVGAARPLAQAATSDALAAQLRWSNTPTGALVAAVSVTAQGAYGLRLGLQVTALPGSAAVRVYSQQHPNTVYEVSGQQILQTLERNLAAGDDTAAARVWWTPELGDAEQTVEFELPAGTDPRALQVSIPNVSHIYEDLSLAQDDGLSTKINDAEICNLDATCYDELAARRNAVARMLFTKGASSYLCTGTLLNDTGSTGTPFFLSANHCISTQTVASSLQTDWFYQSSNCNARTLSSQTTRRLGGASLLYANASGDVALMRLNDAPPAGVTFAGWDATGVANAAATVGLHHPRGDMLKASFGRVVGQAECRVAPGQGITCATGSGNYYHVQWNRGTTEGGSSGSALFRDGYVVGTLYGGVATCTAAESSDFYGRFDLAYRAGLSTWLVTPTQPTNTRVPVFRFYNASTGAHFFTASAGERDFVARTYPAFRYEHVAFYAYAVPTSGLNPVFRFYNGQSGAHFYTISAGERDFVRETYPVFSYEGPSWYAQTGPGGSAAAMYRFFNTSSGAHFYTISAAERDFVIGNYPVFKYEGAAYYAWTAQS